MQSKGELKILFQVIWMQ